MTITVYRQYSLLILWHQPPARNNAIYYGAIYCTFGIVEGSSVIISSIISGMLNTLLMLLI
jgi:hypothetical protein